MPSLAGGVVGVPVVVHYIRKNCRWTLSELLRPCAAENVPQRDERRVERHYRSGYPRLFNRDPVLGREPLMACAGIHVFGGIDDSILNLIVELRLLHGKRKGEVDSLLTGDPILVYVFHKFDLLFMIEEPDPGRYAGSVHVLAFHSRHPPGGCAGNRYQAAAMCGMDLKMRRRIDAAVLQHGVGSLIAPPYIKILPEPVRALLVHELALQFLIVDAAYRAGGRVKRNAVIRAFDRGSVFRFRRSRCFLRGPQRIYLITGRRHILRHETDVTQTAAVENFHWRRFACRPVYDLILIF